MARVLVVDDEPSYRKYLEQYLSHEGYEVRTAGSSSEAMQIATEFAPDVLLADWMLKDRLHGLDIGLALRATDANLPLLLKNSANLYPSNQALTSVDGTTYTWSTGKPGM